MIEKSNSPLGVALLARDVEQQVGRESKNLLTDEHEEGVEGSVTHVVLPVDLVVGSLWDAEVRAGFGNVSVWGIYMSWRFSSKSSRLTLHPFP